MVIEYDVVASLSSAAGKMSGQRKQVAEPGAAVDTKVGWVSATVAIGLSLESGSRLYTFAPWILQIIFAEAFRISTNFALLFDGLSV